MIVLNEGKDVLPCESSMLLAPFSSEYPPLVCTRILFRVLRNAPSYNTPGMWFVPGGSDGVELGSSSA